MAYLVGVHNLQVTQKLLAGIIQGEVTLLLCLKVHRMLLLHVVVVLLFNVHGKHLRSCRDVQLT